MVKEFNKGFVPVFFAPQKQRNVINENFNSCFYKIVFAACLRLLASCGNKSNTASPSMAKPYGVITIVPRATVTYSDFPATIQGQQNVEIRPQIDGYMQALYVDEGSVVKKGQLLFRIRLLVGFAFYH